MKKNRVFKGKVFSTNEDGSTAIEFALLAIPFVLTIVALIELSVFFATTTVMEGALASVTRQIRVGAIQSKGTIEEMEEEFAKVLCERAGIVANCDDIEYEVKKLDDFSADITTAVDDEGFLVDPVFEADQITAGCVVLVRVAYKYKFMTPLIGSLWANYPDNKRLIMSTSVVKSEPFDFETSENCDIG